MIKLLGAIIIIASSFGIGHILSESVSKRVTSISLLVDFIEFVSVNITMYKTPLDEIYRSVNNTELLKNGFSKNLHQGVFFAAKKSGMLYGDEECELIKTYEEKIGTASVAEAEKICLYTVSRLKSIEERLRNELPDKWRVYNTVSILAGASAVIIMI